MPSHLVFITEDWRVPLGSLLARQRIALGLTQEDVAQISQYPVRSIQRAERGRASLQMVQTLFSSLGLDIAILLADSEYAENVKN